MPSPEQEAEHFRRIQAFEQSRNWLFPLSPLFAALGLFGHGVFKLLKLTLFAVAAVLLAFPFVLLLLYIVENLPCQWIIILAALFIIHTRRK